MIKLRASLNRCGSPLVLAVASTAQALFLLAYWVGNPASPYSPALVFGLVIAALTLVYLWRDRSSPISNRNKRAEPPRFESKKIDKGDFREFWAKKMIAQLNERLERAHLDNLNVRSEDLRMFLGALAALDMNANTARKAAELAEDRVLSDHEWQKVEPLWTRGWNLATWLPVTYVSWDWRPAVLFDRAADGAWAVVKHGGPWVRVDWVDVANTGSILSKESWHELFSEYGPLDLRLIHPLSVAHKRRDQG